MVTPLTRLFVVVVVVVVAGTLVSGAETGKSAEVSAAVCVDDKNPNQPTGFLWLVDGCSISTYLHKLTRTLFNKFHERVCARDVSEIYKEIDVASMRRQKLNLVDYMRRDDELFGDCPENRSRFVIGKLRYRYRSYLPDDRPSFLLTSAIRSNIPEYLACLLRDQTDHDFHDETRGISLANIGYLVDSNSGDKWNHQATGFRDDKDRSNAFFKTANLPTLLDRVYAAIMLSHRKVLLDAHVDGTVYSTEDLTDFSTLQKRRSAAELWVSLLARAGALANVDDVMNVLNSETTVPCDLRPRIFNLDEVRTALNGSTTWERTVYCPDEWDALQRSRSKK